MPHSPALPSLANLSTDTHKDALSTEKSCASVGMDWSFMETRLKHASALKKYMQALRHPLHRFSPLQYPVVIDADFLSLYSQHAGVGLSTDQQQRSRPLPAFSKLRYRASDAPVDGGNSMSRGLGTGPSVPWRTVPPVLPPDQLSAAMATADFGKVLGYFRLTAASIVRWCVVYGQLIFLSDAIPADRNSMKQSLEDGGSLLVSPGGIAEIYETNPTEERLHLQDRVGIVRLAMQTGARLVPVYCFGNSQAYRLPWGIRFLQPFARLMRTALITFYGRFGLPVAFRVPLLYAIGRPLQIPQVDQPSREDIASGHHLLVEEVRRIFDTYKGLYGWRNKQLEIL
ncbi:diacylglycerol O-acyltransferase 2-like protein 6 [Cyclospora cayetanensis]|uniref:Acyltransferase n=1 Tax=Cyclospora cayetanensis TaxID=88456 RepID=A0A6P6RTP0_9EIME|nr:diacylglycerol O-acyltransferase 2-like protein 6 [Cyclospora cayetanensis]